jgi:PAS domain S-box-containing protein
MQTIKILLIDDDADDFLITEGLLADVRNPSCVYELEWCSDYALALEKMKQRAFDVYLLDFHMGKHNGLELLKTALAAGVQEPMIMLTGLGDVEIDSQAIKAGAADYLVKGQFSEDLLDRSIRHALDRSQMQRALKESEERYALAAKGANDGLWDWQLKTNEVYFSERWKAMLGFADHELMNCLENWLERLHPDDKTWVEEAIDRHVKGETSKFEIEYRMQAKDKTYRRMLARGLAVRDIMGQAYRMAGWQTDLSTRVASYDALTSLPNRSLFFERLNRAVERKQWDKAFSYAVFFLDLDSFKVVNDSLGHAAGDALLLEVAARLERCLRSSDTLVRYPATDTRPNNGTVARFGGDEFAILIEGIHSKDLAISISERIHESLAKPFQLLNQTIFTSASIGVSMGHQDYVSVEDVLRDADIAMYRAKSGGKSRHAIFDADMHGHVKARLAFETDLRNAFIRQEFKLFYQPIVDLGSWRIKGFEALLRWQHPCKGLIPPDVFIPVAEETGLIEPLGLWVLEEALEQLKEWRKCYPRCEGLSVSVNLSSKQLSNSKLFDQIVNVLTRVGMAPQYLNLEVTESMMFESANTAIGTLEQLRQLGVRVKIDDFGTGYSSLSRLHALPLDVLKIDRSFINNFLERKEHAGIVKTVISLAKTLGLSVIAEGIETLEQAQKLKELECQGGQGYYFSRPCEAKQITLLLDKQIESLAQWA